MIVLASQSASRRAMLEAAGIPFRAQPADLDERAVEQAMGDVAPGVIALALAEAKALAVSAMAPGEIVLGSDSLVECAGRRFDKPRDRAMAAEHLRFFSGRAMRLHSAAALARDGALLWRDDAMASLHVIDMSEQFIEDYLAAEWPAVAGCVGVFRIEGRGVQLFCEIEGDQFTVLGMPLLRVLGALRELGVLAR
ncbi:Maf family protein [Novosphingobium album (ex Liu et al. 2023)]|uniref:Nucleoside triphosphate pyrophosphatase n=1 Tax=Novosphingobium album (ex Liu et al. 2023) TaxID=3031130 RepID=A0ABT5WNZ3_9SPHN|nr:Maf family protein [Novosphingobium album (ex Liu et al. 2023)]MDE8651769.1 Maf family protein [Novosphingobium album (ex Liu et al. 2023)]